jgi:hypothetical protein
MTQLIHIVELFARGGGGGSGSGGGSGGIFFIIGYAPTYYGAKQLRIKFSEPLSMYLTAAWTIIYMALMALFISVSPFFGVMFVTTALAGGIFGYMGIHAKLFKKFRKAQNTVKLAGEADPAWQKEVLLARVQVVFDQYQKDWSEFNFLGIKTYTTEQFFYHNQLMLMALHNMGRQNIVSNPKLLESEIIDAQDSTNNEQDYFVAHITAGVQDQLIDLKNNNAVIFQDNNQFEEFWRFERVGRAWILAGIKQITEASWRHIPAIEAFAQANKFCYSPDWGWLLLPKRGQLFRRADFGRSDINNHVIGLYHKVIVQIYSYVPAKNNSNNQSAKQYVIAQTDLPRSYGNIVVRHRYKLNFLVPKPRGLTKVSMEWGDFNKKYDVFASDMEQVTSFELLNPSFMVKLEALPFKTDIEVVDNVVYLNTKDRKADYATMLQILKESFDEMKL